MEKNENFTSSSGLMFIKTEHLKRGYCCGNGCRGCLIYYGKLPPVKKKGADPKQ